jgi:hypothetical protein
MLKCPATLLSVYIALLRNIWKQSAQQLFVLENNEASKQFRALRVHVKALLDLYMPTSCTRPRVAVTPYGATEENEERCSPRFKYV